METELYHYGVKGMKWGVRRYRNTNGTLTAAGKKQAKARREGDSDAEAARRKQMAKKVAVAALATASVAAVAYAYSKNPEAVNKFVAEAGKKTVNAVKAAPKKAADAGKKAAKEAIKGVKEGIKESVREAPKKATKVIITGVTMNIAKKMLDNYLGKEESEKIFKANNPKKIDSFWKVQQTDTKKDEDD